jgi:hypothetical protein
MAPSEVRPTCSTVAWTAIAGICSLTGRIGTGVAVGGAGWAVAVSAGRGVAVGALVVDVVDEAVVGAALLVWIVDVVETAAGEWVAPSRVPQALSSTTAVSTASKRRRIGPTRSSAG